jgi:hypothetical protein
MEKPIKEPFCLTPRLGVPELRRFTGMVVRIVGDGTGGGLSVVGLYAAGPVYIAPGAAVEKAAWLFAWYMVISAWAAMNRRGNRHKERMRRLGVDIAGWWGEGERQKCNAVIQI